MSVSQVSRMAITFCFIILSERRKQRKKRSGWTGYIPALFSQVRRDQTKPTINKYICIGQNKRLVSERVLAGELPRAPHHSLCIYPHITNCLSTTKKFVSVTASANYQTLEFIISSFRNFSSQYFLANNEWLSCVNECLCLQIHLASFGSRGL